MDNLLALGVRFIVALQGLGGWQVPLMKFFTFLGTEEFYMLVLPALYWCFSNSLGARVALMLMLSGGVNEALKLTFHAPRPYWYSPQVRNFAVETSFGVPSGHAQNAVAIWGTVAAYLKKFWGWVLAVLLMFWIGFSRLSLGVHFPHDVLVGWLVGACLLWLSVRAWKPLARWARGLSLGSQAGLAFLASLALMAIAVVPLLWLHGNWQPPVAWAGYATEAVSANGLLTTGGALFGLLLGLAWLERAGGFQVRGAWWKLVLRYVLGVIGVLIIQYGLKVVLPGGETLVGYLARYLRYALTGLWLTGGAPLIFVRCRLAERAR
jgi:membrane-associated phospholipid phosphatase